MIKLIVGLGNPGLQYEKTRHNAGFLLLDYLQKSCSSSWSVESRFQGVLCNCSVAGNKLLLLKPQTFMNKSGMSVGGVARYYKVKAEDVLVVHDELDLNAGIVRLKKGGGHAGHNGLRDIIENLGENSFYRLRLGIGRPKPGRKVADFVLSDFSKQEMLGMQLAFEVFSSYVDKLVLGQVAVVMNGLNKK